MPFIYYHKEKVQVEKGRITQEAYRKLEKMLTDLGWSNLRWCPSPQKQYRYSLIGCPPGHDNKHYWETVIHTFAVKDHWGEDSGEVWVRDYLKGKVFESEEGVGWGYKLKKSIPDILFDVCSQLKHP